MVIKYLSERRWVLVYAICTLLITSIPYLIGYARQSVEWRFTGFVLGVEDGNSYIAKMLTGAYGAWLFQTPYTAYAQTGFLAFFPYILLGKLTSVPGQHEQLVGLFQIFRWAGGLSVCLATYDLISLFIQNSRLRRICLILATVGGGLGWLSILGLQGLWQGGVPLDFYSPETFGFLSIYGLPHLAVGRALLLWGLFFYLQAVKQNQGEIQVKTGIIRFSILGGISWLLLGFMQPLTVVVGWAVLCGFVGLKGLILIINSKGKVTNWNPLIRCLKPAGLMVSLSSPFVFYNVISSQVDPYLNAWADQNQIFSPPFIEYILAYGLILPLLIIGIHKGLKDKGEQRYLLIGWVVIFPFLAYAPFMMQRRLPEGVWVAITILGICGCETLTDRFRKRVTAIGLGLSLISPIVLVTGGIITTWFPASPIYRPADEVAVFTKLAAISTPGQVALASYETSNALPAWAAIRTVTGHTVESIHYSEIQSRVDRFFSDGTSNDRYQLLDEFKVVYVIFGPIEHAKSIWNPGTDQRFRIIFQKGDYEIFRYAPSDACQVCYSSKPE